MPANRKHLTKNVNQRVAKISAAIVGGYLVTVAGHLALAQWVNPAIVLITAAFSGFIIWAGLMVVAFLMKNGWKTWGLYLSLTAIFAFITYLGKILSPII